MSNIAQQAARLIDLLPEQDQNLAFELVKKLILAWDADYTKVTPEEYNQIINAENEIENGDFVKHDEIEWL